MTVYIVRNTSKSNAISVALQAAEILQCAGAKVIFEPSMRAFCKIENVEYLSEPAAFEYCDAVITVGGDGTILHTAKECLQYNRPILGINLGRTGFLATCELEEMENKLTRMARGEFDYDKRILLNAAEDGDYKKAKTALNDVVIYKGSRLQTIDFNIYCDDIRVIQCPGDGVIIATPTGSTAYSLSAGGPILDARIEGIVVTMICAHSLNQPSMVFSADRHIRIEATAHGRNDIFISTDGEKEHRLKDGSYVEVELSQQSAHFVTFNPADQFDAIDKKLRVR